MVKKTKPKPRSIYGDHREAILPIHVETVGELKAALEKFPDELPLFGDTLGEGAALVWFNVGREDEHLNIEEDDDTWTMTEDGT